VTIHGTRVEETTESLESYRAGGGYQSLLDARDGKLDVIERLHASALRGRGGAGFPVATKWSLARDAAGETKYVVANGGEHEPGSGKDRFLVRCRPHRVLEGALLCAHATGAQVVYLYLIEDMSEAIAAAQQAIEALQQTDLLGDARVELALAPTTYVAGEETAALEVIEGRKAWPRKKPPYPGQAGLWGKPTTVNNVESFAQIPTILRNPEAALRMLVTLDDTFKNPGIYDVELGVTFREVIDGLGGGLADGGTLRGFSPALSSAFLAASNLDLPLEHEAVRAAGSNLGCAGLSLVSDKHCMVERCSEIAGFFMREQCGQCPPCRMETNTMAAVLKRLLKGEAGAYRAQIDKVAKFARGKGNCSLIEMAAAPIQSAMTLFAEDFEQHAETGSCRG
jgi:NADH:ubiquinone oxidoreductase subunit F (NADH-binding)